ncbi:hypothetical protein QYE76_021623 [Lolium multiflorum]|uniref:Uncharacterized protein n=1 Tax=Lolium multiflorum TaxID=4521 RepID=A0AAD8R8Q7_LOLMU|nr:hypothetical protein QYE76_021623 [Lolium multiflorum]
MSTSNRIIKPGYESYQPVVAARQFGLGQVSPHFFLHHLTESRADLPDVLTSQRGYSFFDALAIPIPHNLSFTSSTEGFETWWSTWKTHAFRRALGPLLKQLDAEYDVPAEQQQDGPEPVHDDGSPFKFLPPAPVVLFCKNSPPLKKVVMHSQPIPTKSASKQKDHLGRCPRASTKARTATDDTSSGEVEEVLMPSATLDLAPPDSVADKAATLAKPIAEAQEPITSSSAVPLVLGEGYDLSNLLTFDPESIEPATSKASAESGPSAIRDQLRHLKALLSSPIETLVEDPGEVKSILEDIQPHLPVTLQEKLWPVVTLSAYSFGRKNTSVSTAELETLRKELEDLEKRVRATKQLIQDKEALIAHSHEEAEGLKAELKTDLAEIRALNQQLVAGQDEDDEAKIAEVDHVHANALHALEAYLQ